MKFVNQKNQEISSPATPEKQLENCDKYYNDIKTILMKICEYTNNIEYSEYSEWLKLCFMLKHTFGDRGFDLLDEVSLKCRINKKGEDKYDYDANKNMWDNIKNSSSKPITIGSLFFRAKQLGIEYYKKDIKKKIDIYGNQDIGNMFVDLWARENVKYNSKSGNIYIYNETNRLWEKTTMFENVMKHLNDKIGKIWEDTVDEIFQDWKKEDNDTRKKELKKNLEKINSFRAKLKDTSYQGKVWSAVKTEVEDLEIENKLNCIQKDYLPLKNRRNICLKNKNIVERQREDYFSFELKGEIMENPDYTDVYKYMNAIFVNNRKEHSPDYVKFIQILLGYFLTGNINHRKIYIFYGIGCNGKSKFVKLIKKMLDLFYTTAPDELITADKKGNKKATAPELMTLRGTRLVVVDELEENEKINSKRAKTIRGDSEITGRNLFCKEYDKFYTQSKLVILTNNQPSINTLDTAIVDSICMIPFNARFMTTQSQEEIEFEKKYDTDEYNLFFHQFFNWCLDGAVQSYTTVNKKMKEPQECIDELNMFVKENNHLENFMDETYIESKDKSKIIYWTDFYNDFKYYCSDKNNYTMEKKKIKVVVETKYGRLCIDKHSKKEYIPNLMKKSEIRQPEIIDDDEKNNDDF
jgi:P4 family phage/plasmid primase-like protien